MPMKPFRFLLKFSILTTVFCGALDILIEDDPVILNWQTIANYTIAGIVWVLGLFSFTSIGYLAIMGIFKAVEMIKR